LFEDGYFRHYCALLGFFQQFPDIAGMAAFVEITVLNYLEIFKLLIDQLFFMALGLYFYVLKRPFCTQLQFQLFAYAQNLRVAFVVCGNLKVKIILEDLLYL